MDPKRTYSYLSQKIITLLTVPLSFLFIPIIGAIVWLLTLDSSDNKADDIERKIEKDWEEASKSTEFN